MSVSQKQTFLHGALILAIGTAVVKIIGALFKVPLGNLIGTAGMANFTAAYNVYSTLFVMSTAGLPVAVSKMISEAGARNRHLEIQKIFRITLTAFVVVGAAGSLLMFFGARVMAGWMNNPDAYYAIMVISPSVLFVAVLSAFRGYHQGQGNMYPTAISQVIEAIGKLFLGYGLAYWIYSPNAGIIQKAMEAAQKVKDGLMSEAEGEIIAQLAAEPLAKAAAGAIAGVALGAFIGALYMIFSRRRKIESVALAANRETRSGQTLLKELLRLAIPITISASVFTLTNLIDTSLVMGRLQDAAGFPLERAKDAFGCLTFAQNLFNLPSAFIMTIGVSVIPAIAAARSRRDYETANKTVSSSLRIACLLAMPAGAGLTALSYPILNLLYGHNQQAAVETAAPLLGTLGFASFFVCLVFLTNAILQSMGKVFIPILTMLVGGTLKIIINYVLVGMPDVNIAGAPIGTLVCFVAISLLNLFFIAREIRTAAFLKVFFKPLLAAVAMGVTAFMLQALLTGAGLSSNLALVCVLGAAVVFYFAVIVLIRALPKEDVLLLPKGEKLAKLLKL